jgi:Skp family chaperone for outer membrane proteins
MRMIVLTRSVVAAASLLASGLAFQCLPAAAQQSPGYFIPPAAQAPSGSRSPAQRPAGPRVPPQPLVQVTPPTGLAGAGAGAGGNAPNDPPIQVQLPPVPDLPPLGRGPAPPAAVIGVLGIPDIMHAATAAQQVEKTIGERREKLNEDAQKEQAAWRDLQQALANQRASLNADQIRTKERELQERITNSQRQFRDRNRFIQEAAQVGLAQIERMLIATIRQVAESRGMNLVLHRAQVALNINEFDITEPVVEQMNKVLPSVVLPPDGVSAVAAQLAVPATPTAAAPATPAPAPASPGPAAPRR